MKIELVDGLYHAELSDGRFMHVTTEVAEEFIALQKQVEELETRNTALEAAAIHHAERLLKNMKLKKQVEETERLLLKATSFDEPLTEDESNLYGRIENKH